MKRIAKIRTWLGMAALAFLAIAKPAKAAMSQVLDKTITRALPIFSLGKSATHKLAKPSP